MRPRPATVRGPIVRSLVAAGALGAAVLALSCGPRVEYRARPGFATEADLPDEVTLPDGTVIRYVSRLEYIERQKAAREGRAYRPRAKDGASAASGGDDKQGGDALSWEELEDGTVRMQAVIPEEVVANAMRAFREERYVELWRQLVAEATRRNAEADALRRIGNARTDGSPPESPRPDPGAVAEATFVAWCSRAREPVLILLNRMSFGFSTNAVIMRKTGPNALSLELTPQVAQDFRYRVVDVVFDRGRVYLGGIR